MPVADGFGGRLVRISPGQLRERSCQVPALPADQHEHVAGTRIFGRQAPDFDDLSLSEHQISFERLLIIRGGLSCRGVSLLWQRDQIVWLTSRSLVVLCGEIRSCRRRNVTFTSREPRATRPRGDTPG